MIQTNKLQKIRNFEIIINLNTGCLADDVKELFLKILLIMVVLLVLKVSLCVKDTYWNVMN